MKRIVSARRHLRDWGIPDMAPLALDGGQPATAAVTGATTQEIADMRGRLASITQTAPPPMPPAPAPAASPARVAAPAIQVPLSIPQADGQTLLRMLAAPDGVTAAAAGEALGKSKSRAADYLKILESRGSPSGPAAPGQAATGSPARRRAGRGPNPPRPGPMATSRSRCSPTRSTTAWSTSTTTPGRAGTGTPDPGPGRHRPPAPHHRPRPGK